jgi:peptide/nickel transport system substrate-binding protein
MKRPALIALMTAILLTGCGGGRGGDEVTVSVIGRETRLRNPINGLPRHVDAALLGAVAQGLVSRDAGGQIEPGLAMRWAISDDGLYYTFRLDNRRADADRIVSRLLRLIRRYRSQPLGAGLDAVREVVAVTPEVIEIRLSAPRPELMSLLAGPAFAILIDGQGSGPLLIDGKVGRLTSLRPPSVPDGNEDEAANAFAKRSILLRGERVGLAVARFVNGEAMLVTGGGFEDFIYTRIANVPANNIQIDPATGLFGFRIARPSPALMATEVRQALALALDRDAIGTALGITSWRPAKGILPPGLTGIPEPNRPFLARAIGNVSGSDARVLAGRVESARRMLETWRAQNGVEDRIRLLVAMPEGPGSAILFAAIARQWRPIGVEAVRVGASEAADLRLIDEVAPLDQAEWFLAHFLCDRGRPCSEEVDRAFRAARSTLDPAEHARKIAETEEKLAAIVPFIPIAQPVRWSLAAPDLPGFKTNSRAVHPLAPLIGTQNGR